MCIVALTYKSTSMTRSFFFFLTELKEKSALPLSTQLPHTFTLKRPLVVFGLELFGWFTSCAKDCSDAWQPMPPEFTERLKEVKDKLRCIVELEDTMPVNPIYHHSFQSKDKDISYKEIRCFYIDLIYRKTVILITQNCFIIQTS